jgi:MerR family transcriptional regulator, light-induced transcriptional regulator
MPDPASFHAEIIESGARSIAAGAAERLLDTAPGAHAFGRPAFPRWHEHLSGRLLELAGAMRAGEPALFGSRLRWARHAFESRGLDIAELAHSIDALEHALSEDLPPGGTEAAAPYLRAARGALDGRGDAEPPALSGPGGQLAARYMLAVLEGDRRIALGLLEAAVREGMTPESVMLDVLIPVAREVGRLWHLGEVAIGEEHFLTSTTMLALGWLRGLMPRPEPNGRSVMIGAVQGNKHELAGRIAGLVLESAGFRVVDLGAETPAPDMVRAAGDFGVDAVLLGVMLTTQIESARHAIGLFRGDERAASIAIVVGGHVFDEAPELWGRIGADGHARTIRDAPGLIAGILDARG